MSSNLVHKLGPTAFSVALFADFSRDLKPPLSWLEEAGDLAVIKDDAVLYFESLEKNGLASLKSLSNAIEVSEVELGQWMKETMGSDDLITAKVLQFIFDTLADIVSAPDTTDPREKATYLAYHIQLLTVKELQICLEIASSLIVDNKEQANLLSDLWLHLNCENIKTKKFLEWSNGRADLAMTRGAWLWMVKNSDKLFAERERKKEVVKKEEKKEETKVKVEGEGEGRGSVSSRRARATPPPSVVVERSGEGGARGGEGRPFSGSSPAQQQQQQQQSPSPSLAFLLNPNSTAASPKTANPTSKEDNNVAKKARTESETAATTITTPRSNNNAASFLPSPHKSSSSSSSSSLLPPTTTKERGAKSSQQQQVDSPLSMTMEQLLTFAGVKAEDYLKMFEDNCVTIAVLIGLLKEGKQAFRQLDDLGVKFGHRVLIANAVEEKFKMLIQSTPQSL